MDSRKNNPVKEEEEEAMLVDAPASPKQCIFSNDRGCTTHPILLVEGMVHAFPVETDLCHLCNSIVKIAFDTEGGPNPLEIAKMRFMCVRAHKHKATFSFNTANGESLDETGLQIDREQSGKVIEDQNSVLKNYLLKYNDFLQRKEEALAGDADSAAWLEDKANKSYKFNGGGRLDDSDMDAVDGAGGHLKHFMQSVFAFLLPVTKMFFQSLVESLMAEFNHIA